MWNTPGSVLRTQDFPAETRHRRCRRGFADIDLDVAVGPLVEQILQFRPQVVTTYDENGGYPHPDHIRCHEVTMAAGPGCAAVAGQQVYYHQTFHQQKVVALHEAAISNGLESPYADWIDDILARPTTVTV